jgi:uncharacterized protein YbjT (DUF2867 family)
MSKTLLIIGATGHMGGSVIRAILSKPQSPFTALAVTRTPDSPAAAGLQQKSPKIKVIKGDLDNPNSIFDAARKESETSPPIWGAFYVQNPLGKGSSAALEQQQGKAFIDACIKNGVCHFVYGSADRHGDDADTKSTNIPGFISKYHIEHHLRESCEESKQMTYTILRPVSFMDNFTGDFVGRVSLTVWKIVIPKEVPLQLVAVKDIGEFAVMAFDDPVAAEVHNVALSLAGDEITFDQAAAEFKKRTGKNIPTTFGVIARAVLLVMKEVRLMFEYFGKERCAADLAVCRRLRPETLSFGEWLDAESDWKK